MSGGGAKPRGGKIGTSIRASVSIEAVKAAEKELAELVEQLGSLRNRIGDAVRQYQSAEKVSANLELELAKCQKEVYINSLFCVELFVWVCLFSFVNRLTV